MTADYRLQQLRNALDRARQRVIWARDELERFDRRAHPGDIMLDRARGRLAEDLRKAELDAAWAEIALADVTSPMEVPRSAVNLRQAQGDGRPHRPRSGGQRAAYGP